MRSGRMRGRVEVDPRSPFAPVADSANRLARDLAAQSARAETAHEGFLALQDAARGYAVVTTDVDGDVRAASPGALPMFGWDEDAIVGRNASLLFDDASWKELLPKLARKSLRERGIETRAVMARRDGARFHARLHVRLLRGPGDEGHGFLLVVQDVTEQVRAEDEMKAAETRARRMIEDLPLGAGIVEGGRVAAANGAMADLLETAPRELAGMDVTERIVTRDVLVVREALGRLEAAREGERWEGDVAVLRATKGRPLDVRLTAVAHRPEGRPGVLVLMRDVSGERRVLAALRAAERNVRSVLEGSEEGYLFLSDEPSVARVRVANRAFLALAGLPDEAVAGRTETELLHALRAGGEGGAAAAGCLAAATGGPVRDVVAWNGAGNRWIEIRAVPIAGAGGRPGGRLLVTRDVTAHKSAELGLASDLERARRRADERETASARLKAVHEDLEARHVEAERLSSELRTLDAMKSDLLANVSHELQTPLVSIRGYTEMIAKGRLGAVNDEQKKGLSLALKNIDRLIALIDNLLAFARMDRDAGAMTLSSFPLAGVIDEVVALVRERLEARRIRVARRLDDPSVTIRADRDKIIQVFLNLVTNAIKFNRDGGAIEIAVRRGKPGFALVQVRDTGMGIPGPDLEKIFDRFYRVDRVGSAAGEGTGIGLAIVRNILRLHGCVIQATSQVGEGTTFAFTLPLAGPKSEPGRPHVDAAEAPRESAADSGRQADRSDEAARGGPSERAADSGTERPRLRIIRR
jgi:PAS domain S-box-containing protein